MSFQKLTGKTGASIVFILDRTMVQGSGQLLCHPSLEHKWQLAKCDLNLKVAKGQWVPNLLLAVCGFLWQSWYTSTKHRSMPAALKKYLALPHVQDPFPAKKTKSSVLQVAPFAKMQELEYCIPATKQLMSLNITSSFFVSSLGSTKWQVLLKRLVLDTRMFKGSIVTAVINPFSYVERLQCVPPYFRGVLCFLSKDQHDGSWPNLAKQSA